MAKPLVVRFGGVEVPLGLQRVDRSDLYGYVEVETFDDQGRPCSLATLAQDGRTLIGPGGAASAFLSPEGRWLDRGELRPLDLEGQVLEPVPSSFSEPVEIGERATIDRLLEHDIRTVYLLHPEAAGGPLQAALEAGEVFTFPFSYRGGLNPDTAFLLKGADGSLFMLVGSPAQIEFVGRAETAAVVEEDEGAAEEDDSVDFSMF